MAIKHFVNDQYFFELYIIDMFLKLSLTAALLLFSIFAYADFTYAAEVGLDMAYYFPILVVLSTLIAPKGKRIIAFMSVLIGLPVLSFLYYELVYRFPDAVRYYSLNEYGVNIWKLLTMGTAFLFLVIVLSLRLRVMLKNK